MARRPASFGMKAPAMIMAILPPASPIPVPVFVVFPSLVDPALTVVAMMIMGVVKTMETRAAIVGIPVLGSSLFFSIPSSSSIESTKTLFQTARDEIRHAAWEEALPTVKSLVVPPAIARPIPATISIGRVFRRLNAAMLGLPPSSPLSLVGSLHAVLLPIRVPLLLPRSLSSVTASGGGGGEGLVEVLPLLLPPLPLTSASSTSAAASSSAPDSRAP